MISYLALMVWSVEHPNPDAGWVRPWLMRGWIKSVIFFGAGVWIRFNGGEDLRIPRSLGLLMLALGYGCLVAGGYWLIVGLPLAMGGLWYSLSGDAWPKMLTSCSFPIYVLHAFMGVGASAAFAALGLKEWAEGSAFAWAVKWSVMAGGSVLAALLLRRFISRFAAMVFGGR